MNINNSGSDGDGDQEDDFEVEISPPSYELMGKAPVKLNWACAHIFDIAPDGTPHPARMNVPVGFNFSTK